MGNVGSAMKEPHSNLSELNGNALKSAGVPLSFAFKHPFSPLVNTLKGIRLFVKLSVSREKNGHVSGTIIGSSAAFQSDFCARNLGVGFESKAALFFFFFFTFKSPGVRGAFILKISHRQKKTPAIRHQD